MIKGVVFDLDGTLVIPVIDFADMRRRVGVPQNQDILDAINCWPPEARQRAFAVIKEIEDEALVNMKLMPDCKELMAFLDSHLIPRGLITRNVRRAVDHFHTHVGAAPFEPAITRECPHPYKPSPEGLLHICRTWGIKPSECMMVGDSAKDDIRTGNRAGAITVLIDFEGRMGATMDKLEGEARPHHIITQLGQLRDLLQGTYQVASPPQPVDVVEPRVD